MSKRKLVLEKIDVTSFDVQPDGTPLKGTIKANESGPTGMPTCWDITCEGATCTIMPC